MEGQSNNVSDSRLMKGVLDEQNSQPTMGNSESSLQQLFHKVLTPSDVGNKTFVIPRRYALKYFSHIQHNEEVDFYDSSTQSWRFKLFYCQSSKKFTFTRGWHKFVQAKNLKAGDTIIFNLCEIKNGTHENSNTFVIDVVKNDEGLSMDLALNHNDVVVDVDAAPNDEGLPMDLALNHNDVAVDVDAAPTPVLLFGKQIGWTKSKRGNEV